MHSRYRCIDSHHNEEATEDVETGGERKEFDRARGGKEEEKRRKKKKKSTQRAVRER